MPQEKKSMLSDPEDGRPWSPAGLARRSQSIAECLYLVEATRFEAAMLWKTTSEQSPTRHGGRGSGEQRLHDWEGGQAESLTARVADIEGRPMLIELRREMIDNIPVCFYTAASSIADHAQADAFIQAVFPGIEKCNALNFGHFAQAFERLSARSEALSLSKELGGSLPKGQKMQRGGL